MLIFVPKLTNRMGYTINVVFHHLLQIDYNITTDADFYRASTDIRLCYGDHRLDDSPYIRSCGLLFISSIEEQNPRPFTYENITALFPTYDREALLPFDLFAATFYLVSRYEEYLPHHIDAYGRYPASESVAGQHGFLLTPVVDHWALMLHQALKRVYPELPGSHRRYRFEATVDIDAAYCYRHKGMLRTLAGIFRDLTSSTNRDTFKTRLRVLSGLQPDPFDTFDYLLEQSTHYPDIQMLFFALMGDYGQYDKPISHSCNTFRELLQHLGDHAKIGIHASFQSAEEPERVGMETRRLADILHRPIVRNRYHYLRLQLPQSYRRLIHEEIRHDYSMGYAETSGYRAGTLTPYPFYDLERDEEGTLIIHPFSVMDTTLIKHQQLSPEEALEHYRRLIDQARSLNGTFCGIWHNQNVCNNADWLDWRRVFEQVLAYGHSDIPETKKQL